MMRAKEGNQAQDVLDVLIESGYLPEDGSLQAAFDAIQVEMQGRSLRRQVEILNHFESFLKGLEMNSKNKARLIEFYLSSPSIAVLEILADNFGGIMKADEFEALAERLCPSSNKGD